MFFNFQTTLLGAAIFFSVLGFADSKLKPVPYVDLKRYMGDWNVIAKMPNFIEKNCDSLIEKYVFFDAGLYQKSLRRVKGQDYDTARHVKLSSMT